MFLSASFRQFRVALVQFPILLFCVHFTCTPFPQGAFDSEPLSSISALANYDRLRPPILTIRFSSENKCFKSCGCSLNVRTRLSPATKSRAGCGRMIRSWILTAASIRRSKLYVVLWGIQRTTLGTSRPWEGVAID